MGFSAHGAAGARRVGPLDVPSDVVELVGSRGQRQRRKGTGIFAFRMFEMCFC